MAWKYREVQIRDDASITDSGTETINLNLRDPITSLIIRFRATNTAALDDTPVQKNITRIEIVDGGQVYYSLSGPQAVAATAYGLGRYPHCWIDGRAGSPQRMKFQLLFGRHLGDEQFAFDPSKLLNPQLKITWADVEGYTDNSLTLGITARIMEGLPSPSKALMWTQVEAWNTASTGDHSVDLPVNYPIRALMTRAYLTGNVWNTIHTRFKMDCDLGKFVPFDLEDDELQDITQSIMGPFQVMQHGVWSYGEAVDAWLGSPLQVNGISHQPAYFTNFYNAGAWHWFVAYIVADDGSHPEDALCSAIATGYYPENCILIPFGRLDSPETWFPAQQYKEIKLYITEGVADAAASVCVQQPRSLP